MAKMSILKKAFKGGVWFSLFKGIEQTFSWITTLIVARILLPEDYGIMEMATILVGYVALFSQLGLGTAIIQREEIKDGELSSLFWFLLIWGFILTIICILLAYPTVVIFKDKRILRVTQAASLLYLVNSLLIIPLNLLQRDFRFKTLGFIHAISTIISCIMMIIIAKLGGGVWTLISGHFTRNFIQLIFIFLALSWMPKMHFDFSKIKPYLKFGVTVAGTNTLHYINNKADKFFGGIAFSANDLGYYSFALELSKIPNDKLLYIINSICFPVFSRFQNNYDDFKKFYLRIVKIIAFFTFPLYIGGFFLADQLVPFVLGEKWIPIIFPFKIICLSQLIVSITAPNAQANNAQGRPNWCLYMGIINICFLPLSFYVASRYSLNALAIPWITIYPLLRIGWTLVTIKKIEISIYEYLTNLKHVFLANMSMLIGLILFKHYYISIFPTILINIKLYLFLAIGLGFVFYAIYILVFQRSFLITFIKLNYQS